MARVVVRVELHGATTEEQYARLHVQMAAAKFARRISGGDGAIYLLPTATYVSDAFETVNAALDSAWSAAAGITASYGVIATQGSSMWTGLPKV